MSVKHPFQVDRSSIDLDALVESTKKVMQMSNEEINSLITEKVGFATVGCPHCRGGAQDASVSVWSIEDPWHVSCRCCGMRFPNEEYPLNSEVEVVNPLGVRQVYRFYDTGDERYRYFFLGRARYAIQNYMASNALKLAQLYHVTGDGRYAYKAAVILNRFAEVYPAWPIRGTIGNYANWKVFYRSPPSNTQSGKWGRWIYDEIPIRLVLAYGLIRDSEGLERLSGELGVDVKRRIEEDLLRASVELVRRYEVDLHNPTPWIMYGMILVGRCIGEPSYVHEAVRMFNGILEKRFFYDGMWCEGTLGYHSYVLRGLKAVMEAAEGYSDPPGYVDPTDGTSFRNLSLKGNRFLKEVEEAPKALIFPDGTYAPIHDTRWKRKASKPLEASTSKILPGYGHAVLGFGKGPNQIQVHLHFGYMYSHSHADNLNIIIYGKGEELLSDIGYTHTKLRPWAASTLAHNTVIIDRKEQPRIIPWGDKREQSYGNLKLYEGGDPKVKAVEASATKAYITEVKDLEVYERTLIMVEVSEEDAYIVDIFRVKGGSTHSWVVHGSADRDQSLECSLSLKPKPGTLLGPDTEYRAERSADVDSESFAGSIYGLVDNLKACSADGVWTATFRFLDGENLPSLRLTMLSERGDEVVVGQAPSIRRAGEDNALVDRYKMPIMIVSRVKRGAPNCFVAVWEPFKGEPFISKVENLQFDYGKDMAVALRIELKDRVDYVISTVDEPPYKLRCFGGDIRIMGRIGVISEERGNVRFMRLIDGVLLAKGGYVLKGSGRVSGRVLEVHRRGVNRSRGHFKVDRRIPEDRPLDGRLMIVVHGDGSTHGYTISRVENTGDHGIIYVKEDPGFEIAEKIIGDRRVTETIFKRFPENRIIGENKFYIVNLERYG